jgi:membrane-bound inhibitor of C-type lysozyme
MNYSNKNEFNRGISSIAIVLIAAVVIGGGAVLISGNNDAEESDDENASTSTQQVTLDENVSTFRCEDGGMITADTSIEGQVEVTLPDGEVQVLNETEGAEGALYTSTDGSFTFLNQEGEAVVEQDGEVTFEGCSIVSSDAAEDDSTEGSATSSMNVDTEAAATTTTNVEVGSDLDTSVEADVEAESETEAQY